jgi:hypothetical protein
MWESGHGMLDFIIKTHRALDNMNIFAAVA